MRASPTRHLWLILFWIISTFWPAGPHPSLISRQIRDALRDALIISVQRQHFIVIYCAGRMSPTFSFDFISRISIF
jgi:hypothetical protein